MGRREKTPVVRKDAEISLGARIRARRWQQGISLRQLATAAGNYDQSHLSHIENGRDVPSTELLETIARILSIDVDALCNASYDDVTGWLNGRRPTVRKAERRVTVQRHEAASGPSSALTGRRGVLPVARKVKTSVAYSRHGGAATVGTQVESPAAKYGGGMPAAPFAQPERGYVATLEATGPRRPTPESREPDTAKVTAAVPAEEAPAMQLTPAILAQVAAALGTTADQLAGVSYDQLLAWLDDPASFHAAMAEAHTASTPTIETIAPAPDGDTVSVPLTPDVLEQVAAMLDTSVQELAGASEEQLVAWLDDPASFAAYRAARNGGTTTYEVAAHAPASPAMAEPESAAAAESFVITVEMLEQVAAMLGATAAELAGASEEQLVAWLDDPASFEAARTAGALPSMQTGIPASAEAESAEPLEITPVMLEQVAGMLGATPAELVGASEAQLVAWLDDPASFAAARTAGTLPAMQAAASAAAHAPAPEEKAEASGAEGLAVDALVSPEMLDMIAQTLEASPEELQDVPYEQLLAWLGDPSLFHEARRAAGTPTPATAPELPAAALATTSEPKPVAPVPARRRELPPITGEPASGMGREQMEMLAAALGASVEELHWASHDQLLEWLANPDLFEQYREELYNPKPVQKRRSTPAMEEVQLSPALLASVAQVLGAEVEDLRGATHDQLMAWLGDPSSYTGPQHRTAAVADSPAEVIPAAASLAELATPMRPTAMATDADAMLEDAPIASLPAPAPDPARSAAQSAASTFPDEAALAHMSTAQRFRYLRELTAHERLGDNPEVLGSLLRRMQEADMYQEAVKSGQIPPNLPEPRVSQPEPKQPPERQSILHFKTPTKPKNDGIGGWLRGLIGNKSKKK